MTNPTNPDPREHFCDARARSVSIFVRLGCKVVSFPRGPENPRGEAQARKEVAQPLV